MSERATVVYRWFDADERLLYVGISGRLERRTRDHERVAPWWTRAARCEATVYATREEAEEAERLAIAREGPEYNVHRPAPLAVLRCKVATETGSCDVCGSPLPPPTGSRGRPALRHPECQALHRREYLRDAKRRERGQPLDS